MLSTLRWVTSHCDLRHRRAVIFIYLGRRSHCALAHFASHRCGPSSIPGLGRGRMCEKVSSVTCRRSVVSSGCSGFLHQKTDFIIISPPWYDPGCCWGVKPLNQTKPNLFVNVNRCWWGGCSYVLQYGKGPSLRYLLICILLSLINYPPPRTNIGR